MRPKRSEEQDELYYYIIKAILVIGVLVGLLGVMGRGNASELTPPNDLGEYDWNFSVSCELIYVEHLGIPQDIKKVEISNIFTFSNDVIIYEDEPLREVSPETIPKSIISGNLRVFYDGNNRLIYLDKPLDKEDLEVSDLEILVEDVVKFSEGYNFYINQFSLCKPLKEEE